MEKTKFASIIITHFSSNEGRSEMFIKSIKSLVENTGYPYELILVDNGSSQKERDFINALLLTGEINVYVRNSSNMHFSYGRNQALGMAQGDYIVIADNDIDYRKDWLTNCVKVLEEHPNEKIYSTPFAYPMFGMNKRYHKGYLKTSVGEVEINARAGSNCFCIRREDFRKIGMFDIHRVGGSLWADKASRAMFNAAVLPGKFAQDMGLRKGYNMKEALPVKINLHNDKSVYLNTDQYFKLHPEYEYRSYRSMEI